jgi:hypothetical protein
MTRRRPVRPSLAAVVSAGALAVLVAACDAPQGPTTGPGLDVWVSAPHAGDQALILEFDAPIESFQPASGFRLFTAPGRASASFIVVADEPLAGGGIRVGTILGGSAGSPPGARIVGAAGSDRQPRDTVDGYAVTLLSP